MPRNYGKIKVEVWESGSDYRLLTLEAQWAYEMLISQEGLSMAGTLPYAPRKWAKLAHGLDAERLEEIIVQLEQDWYVIVDRETEELLIRSFVKHDAPWRTPNFLTAARSKYRSTESETIRDYLRKRHPWLADLSLEKDAIEEFESQASARPFERTSELPFERTSPRSSPQGDSRAREASPEPEAAPSKGRGVGSGTLRARETPPAPLAAAPSAKVECPVCGPLHNIAADFDLRDHLANVHGLTDKGIESLLASRTREVA